MHSNEKITAVVARVINTKAMHHAKDAYFQAIEDILVDKEFVQVFKDELQIEYLTGEELSLIIDELYEQA